MKNGVGECLTLWVVSGRTHMFARYFRELPPTKLDAPTLCQVSLTAEIPEKRSGLDEKR
jgi:hypothetical protein